MSEALQSNARNMVQAQSFRVYKGTSWRGQWYTIMATAVGWDSTCYHVAEPNSYLFVTGVGIEKVRIRKKEVSKISITSFDFSMGIQAMTIEKLQFALPAVFTIGPADSMEALEKYAVLLTGESDDRPPAAASKGAITGETRSIVSTMTMEELFHERKVFRDKVIQSVQSELDQFGLCTYNANVKELQDTPGSEYFAFLSRKAHEGALNQAKVYVADARMRGEVGEAEKQGKTKQEVAKIHAATAMLETERKAEKATADAKLTNKEIEIGNELNIARINAKREAEARNAQLTTAVEQKRALMGLERLRATKVVQAKIQKESSQQNADAALYAQEKAAEGKKFSEKADAEAAAFRRLRDAEVDYAAKEREAEANFLVTTRQAEAAYFAQERDAQGLTAMAKAYGELAHVLGGPHGLLNMWTTGAHADADATAPIRNLFQSLPPLLSTIHDQTGMQPPSWLAQMPAGGETLEAEKGGLRIGGGSEVGSD
ncbi:hypothetical protein CC86DRAFT_398472 [Ophiobolus disseminans]|uniref:Band 7 domain-containing protein n=1 Tax=Ophiobolus disseminans TaxID=1469910 RepID=A0A6A6ZFB4_9PLEO|nr:hypothetical protein CC86DRAFT_398472 [Ophiobolus disseminans]